LLGKVAWGRAGLTHGRKFLSTGAEVIESFPDYSDLALPSTDKEGDIPNGVTFVQMTDYIFVPLPRSVIALGFGCDDGIDVAGGATTLA
jgi:hypothetical protein